MGVEAASTDLPGQRSNRLIHGSAPDEDEHRFIPVQLRILLIREVDVVAAPAPRYQAVLKLQGIYACVAQNASQQVRFCGGSGRLRLSLGRAEEAVTLRGKISCWLVLVDR
jgi:hypothetical protein